MPDCFSSASALLHWVHIELTIHNELILIEFLPGAYIFLLIELPAEKERHEEKLNRTKDVEASIDYLKSIFYHYATNTERYNFTRDQYRDAVYADLDTFKKFVVDYYNDYNYDMTDGWDYAWTFPKALLFTITIMTTIGTSYECGLHEIPFLKYVFRVWPHCSQDRDGENVLHSLRLGGHSSLDRFHG